MPRSLPTIAAVLLALGLVACEKSPDAPDYDNPFDPDGPGGGDALALNAVVSGGDIILTWQQPQNHGIFEYAIQHSLSRDTGYEDPIIVAHTEAATNLYNYQDAAPTTAHWFRIQAVTAAGDFSIVSYAEPALAVSGPLVTAGDGSGSTATRQLELAVTVDRGDQLSLATGPDFADETIHTAGAPGEPVTLSIDLGPAEQDSTFQVRVISFGDSFTSAATVADVKVDFSPEPALVGGGTLVADLNPELAIPTEGVVRMRFATTEEGLAAAPWFAPVAVFDGVTLDTAPVSQSIWSEFEGDFGFASPPTELVVTPDLLTGAAFRLAVPQDRVTDSTPVQGIVTGARATLMRWARTPDLAGAAWQAFADTIDVDLGPETGPTTVYMQLRNVWADSPVLSDYAIYVDQGVAVDFVAPTDGDDVLSGVPLLVRGTATGGTVSATVDSVKIDTGDGAGWESVGLDPESVNGLDAWAFEWDVPAVTEAVARDLRARCWAGTDSATTVISVTLTP